MNLKEQIIGTLLHYGAVVRDSMEYTLGKQDFKLTDYNTKKYYLSVEIEQDTPLKRILDHSDEKGQEVYSLIKSLANDVYGENSEIIKVVDKKIVVDHEKQLPILINATKLFLNISAMINGLIQQADNEKEDISEVKEINDLGNKYFSAIVNMTYLPEMFAQFGHFQDAMTESKGEITSKAQLAEEKLNELTKTLYEVTEHMQLPDEKYIETVKTIRDIIDYMAGNKQMDKDKSFKYYYDHAAFVNSEFLVSVGEPYTSKYKTMLEKLVHQADNNNGKTKA